jgi:hypothetical protein
VSVDSFEDRALELVNFHIHVSFIGLLPLLLPF